MTDRTLERRIEDEASPARAAVRPTARPATTGDVVTGHRIGGRVVDPPTARRLASEDPSTGAVLAEVPIAGSEEASRAVDLARRALPGWAATPVEERAAALRRAAGRVRERTEALARLHADEVGRPIEESRGAVVAAASAFDQYAELGPLHRGRSLRGDSSAIDLMEPVPRGVAAVITPWNDPLPIAATHLAANLVVGNTVVLKPSELSPLCTTALFDALVEPATAGDTGTGSRSDEWELPVGVAALLQGDGGTGAALVSAGVDLVAHTGSVRTGREIAMTCGEHLVKAIVELGGCDALVVDSGVDPSWAADQIALGAFTHAGQICTAVERVLLHRDIADRVLDALAARARRMRTGPARHPDTEMGPLISCSARDRVQHRIAEAIERGARPLTPLDPPDGPGWFHPATVVVDVPLDCDLWREETFGPVAPVRIVDSFDEGLALAADSPYGLAATILTPSLANAAAARRTLSVGTLKINAAFGGAPGGSAEPAGCSGLARGFGPELLDEVTRSRVLHQAPAPLDTDGG